MRLFTSLICLLILHTGYVPVNAQQPIPKQDLTKSLVPFVKNFKMGALFVSDYKMSLTENVDLNGLHHSEGTEAVDGFSLRYVRISGNYQLNEKISASVLINLADFKNNPQTRVLENASIKYKFNTYAVLYVGQFRPFFGIEDMYPFEFRRSYIWSNQYEEFGRNGWQSFQLGMGLTGSLQDKGIPLYYYLSIVNGNGKNMTGDNDRNKDLTWRLEYQFHKRLKVGINRGVTRYDHQKADTYGIDMQGELQLSLRCLLSIDAEYKNGTNFNEYSSSKLPDKDLSDYRMGGIYFTPNVRYHIGLPVLRGIEFSARYEYFERRIKNGNPRTTITPFFGILLADDYAAKLSFGMTLDRYRHQEENTRQRNSDLFFTQFQFKF